MYRNIVKPTFDFLAAFFGLIILSPIFVIVTIGLMIANKGTPFFFQKRPGKNERIFSIIKFKSMNDKKDLEGHLLPDAQRLTKIGAFVRKTSLDEIPQLINILKGDMSLIGPRPLFERYLPFYTAREKLRHTVKPGITGLAQISGRNFLGWNERLEMDVKYAKELSLRLDIQILTKTVINVLKAEKVEIIPGKLGNPLDIDRSRTIKK
ncbi:sugar transferase [Aequorivita vladivostokensis]|uniref:sugar transferase n=1 Tax=Aequorivita vladivostokensis TaxID=171194 RepID=UPI0005D3ACDE|nr:sugar transferase [Aequorivita vladivostokensis]